MMEAVQTDPGTAPSESDGEALYDRLFGVPALDALAEEEKESESFARVYEVARERPWVALRAAYEGVAAHFRNAGPFDYAVGEARERGEVAP